MKKLIVLLLIAIVIVVIAKSVQVEVHKSDE
jgi:hypothetical protein